MSRRQLLPCDAIPLPGVAEGDDRECRESAEQDHPAGGKVVSHRGEAPRRWAAHLHLQPIRAVVLPRIRQVAARPVAAEQHCASAHEIDSESTAVARRWPVRGRTSGPVRAVPLPGVAEMAIVPQATEQDRGPPQHVRSEMRAAPRRRRRGRLELLPAGLSRDGRERASPREETLGQVNHAHLFHHLGGGNPRMPVASKERGADRSRCPAAPRCPRQNGSGDCDAAVGPSAYNPMRTSSPFV